MPGDTYVMSNSVQAETLSGSLRAPPFHRRAVGFFIRLANQFWPPATDQRVCATVKVPLRILVNGTIVLFWKAALTLIGTELRRSDRVDQSAAADPVQGRDIQLDTRRHKLHVFLPSDGDLNKALPKRLK
jgi:hypothetical protein